MIVNINQYNENNKLKLAIGNITMLTTWEFSDSSFYINTLLKKEYLTMRELMILSRYIYMNKNIAKINRMYKLSQKFETIYREIQSYTEENEIYSTIVDEQFMRKLRIHSKEIDKLIGEIEQRKNIIDTQNGRKFDSNSDPLRYYNEIFDK
jgi:hypothetical protein